jgi:hypothetical protein
MSVSSLETLYHSFPRRSGADGDGVKKGIGILERILKRGLVLTPEVVEWRVSFNPNPTYVAQKRVCFTSLSTEELREHSETFGALSIGFARSRLETIGATPVFYIPRSLISADIGRNIGSFYIERLLQIQLFLENNPKSFRIGSESLHSSDLSNFTRFLTGLFYPVEDVRHDGARFYFSQREWRVLANLHRGNAALSEVLSDEAKADIAAPPVARLRDFPPADMAIDVR